MQAMSEAGFTRPGYAQLLEAQKTRAIELFGADVDVSEQSVLGKFIRLSVYDLAILYEEMEEVYLSRFPHMAQGVSLDRLMPFAGLRRNNATAAVHRLRVQGTASARIEFASLVSTPKGVAFRVQETVVLDENGAGICEIICTELGSVGNVDSSEICVLSQPQVGIEHVKGESLLQAGQEVESDESLRRRFDEAVRGIASGTAEAVRGAVLRVENVRACFVLENSSNTIKDGIPAHSFACYVLEDGADEEKIARSIYEKKPLGIQSHGEVAVQVLGTDQEMHSIYFSRVSKKILHLRARIVVNAHFLQDGSVQLKNSLSEYVCTKLQGESLSQTSLYPFFYDLSGIVEVENLGVSEDDGQTYHSQKVTATISQVLWLSVEDIELEVREDVDGG